MIYPFDHDILTAISPHSLAGYLRSRQWIDAAPWGEFSRLYKKNVNEQPAELVLPVRAGLNDYARRVAELIEELAQFDRIPIAQIINDLTLAIYDVVRIRTKTSDTLGTISLEAGEELFESGRDLIAMAATHEASGRPAPNRRGRAPDVARDYMERVRLGQTERGSFIVTFLSPYSYEPPTEAAHEDVNPFGRRVVERLSSALGAIDKALERSVTEGPRVFEDGVKMGVSAQLCRALGQIAECGSEAEISVGWSVQKPNDRPVKLTLGRATAPVLLEAASILSAYAPPETITINGTVTNVKEEETELEGRIRLATQFGNRFRRIQATFNPQDRATVFSSFKDKKDFYISITGELNKKTRPWTLENPREFQMVEFEASETLPDLLRNDPGPSGTS